LDKGGEKAIIKKLCGDLKVKAECLSDLMEIKKSMLDTEKQRTEKARKNWEKNKPLSWNDFSLGLCMSTTLQRSSVGASIGKMMCVTVSTSNLAICQTVMGSRCLV
jgi:hypothetical protein